MFLRAIANNEYVNSHFNKNKDIESHIVSLDVNSRYPTAMSYKLPPNWRENLSPKMMDQI